MTINPSFITQLRTAIYSTPIIYIPHYHYGYIDSALEQIVSLMSWEFNGQKAEDVIFEYSSNSARYQIDFKSKKRSNGGEDSSLDTVLLKILQNEEFTIEDPESGKGKAMQYKVFLFKNIVQSIASEPELLLLLQTFIEKYERGEYNPLTTIILVDATPVSMLPMALSDIVSVYNIPLPTHEEIAELVSAIPTVRSYRETKQKQLRDELCRHLQGLGVFEINQIIRTAAYRSNNILTEQMIKYVLEEKQNIIKKNGVIEVYESDISFDQVGGLEVLIEDLKHKSEIFQNLSEVQKLRITLPKGVLLIGMPGCGKSMVAKAIANQFNVSLLRLDISRLMGKYVGESEENLRRALSMAEAANPCVLWIDEIEKAFAGANGGGNDGDMLVQRMMGYFLTWMQEHRSAVYIVATANDAMRPEFMRKGRFDEVYFIDFPTTNERTAIFNKNLQRYLQPQYKPYFNLEAFIASQDVAKVIAKMDKFAGSEIVSVINTVIERCYVDYVKLRTPDLQMPEPIQITANHFYSVIEHISPHIMSKQGEQGKTAQTPIQKIREMQNIYKFKPASK